MPPCAVSRARQPGAVCALFFARGCCGGVVGVELCMASNVRQRVQGCKSKKDEECAGFCVSVAESCNTPSLSLTHLQPFLGTPSGALSLLRPACDFMPIDLGHHSFSRYSTPQYLAQNGSHLGTSLRTAPVAPCASTPPCSRRSDKVSSVQYTSFLRFGVSVSVVFLTALHLFRDELIPLRCTPETVVFAARTTHRAPLMLPPPITRSPIVASAATEHSKITGLCLALAKVQ